MRSLIILEVEHGDTLDPLDSFVGAAFRIADIEGVEVNDYTVRVDVPPCFVLDSGNTESKE